MYLGLYNSIRKRYSDWIRDLGLFENHFIRDESRSKKDLIYVEKVMRATKLYNDFELNKNENS